MESIDATQVVPQELVYLSQKTTHLAAPGTKLNDLYYSSINSKVDLVESTCSLGRYRQTLSSTAFGSSSSTTIPNGSFLGQSYLHLELPNLVANQSLIRGWALAAIDSIEFLFGASNISSLQITGQTLMDILLLQCESEDKASEMYRLAGEEHLAPLTAIPNGDIPTISGDILLPLPWSSLTGMISKKFFDSSLLNNPITINVRFKRSDAIYGGIGARPSNFEKAELLFRQSDLTNKDLSLKSKLMRQPDLVYNYPFLHHQSYISQSFQGKIRSGGVKNIIPLLGFINADLVGLVFSVVKVSDLQASATTTPAPFNSVDISNIDLQYNGQTVFYSPDKGYKLYNMINATGASYIKNSVVRTGSQAPFISDPVDNYRIFVDFSQLRPSVFSNEYANVWRIPNNTLSVEFNCPTTDTYQLFATYVYNGMASITANGESRIFFS